MLDAIIINLPLLPQTILKNCLSQFLESSQKSISSPAQTQRCSCNNSLNRSTWFIVSIAFYIIPFPFYFTIIPFWRTKKEKGERVLRIRNWLSQTPVGSLVRKQPLRRAQISALGSGSPHLSLSTALYPTFLSSEEWHPNTYDSLKHESWMYRGFIHT